MGNGTDRVQKELKFKQLYKQYYVPFCLYAKRYMNDISLCEDLISDVFTNLWNRIGDLGFTRERIYTLEELYRMLHETLEKLPESHRAVFTKTFVEGKKQEEIAKELDINVKSVNRYKQKTLEILRSELKDYLPLLLLLIRLR